MGGGRGVGRGEWRKFAQKISKSTEPLNDSTSGMREAYTI